MDSFNRRLRIFNYLLARRKVKTSELAAEFLVTNRTIRMDIRELSRVYPLITKQGFNGKEIRMTKEQRKKYVRYAEGAEIYSMSLRKFPDMAKDAGAIYKVGKMVLVNGDIFDQYLETFRLV